MLFGISFMNLGGQIQPIEMKQQREHLRISNLERNQWCLYATLLRNPGIRLCRKSFLANLKQEEKNAKNTKNVKNANECKTSVVTGSPFLKNGSTKFAKNSSDEI